jgi:hypothetical protein
MTVTAADIEIAYMHISSRLADRYSGVSPSDRRGSACTSTTARSTRPRRRTRRPCGINAALTGTTGTTSSLDDVDYPQLLLPQRPMPTAPACGLAGTCSRASSSSNCTFKLVGDTAWTDAIQIATAGATLGLIIRDCDFLERGERHGHHRPVST